MDLPLWGGDNYEPRVLIYEPKVCPNEPKVCVYEPKVWMVGLSTPWRGDKFVAVRG